jgi:cytochrome c peroxidase
MLRIFICIALLGLLAWQGFFNRQQSISWSEAERAKIASLRLPDETSLKRAIVHTGNPLWNNLATAKLGQQLFFDTKLSKNKKVACATCHQPSFGFADSKPLSIGISTTKRHSPTLIGAAFNTWQFWDGRADSLWAQALGPLEDPAEHGANRLQLAKIISTNYKQQYETIFGTLNDFSQLEDNATPLSNNSKWQKNWQKMSEVDKHSVNLVFANIGKSLAAYQSLFIPNPSKFDQFASELATQGSSSILSRTEQQGLKLFIDDDKSQCMRCHNGPFMTNNDFQVTGIKDPTFPVGTGRQEGVIAAINSEFNCKSIYSTTHNKDAECLELDYAKRTGDELKYAFKVPTLRNISQTAPYMHNGSFDTLQQVLHFYTRAKSQYSDTDIETERNTTDKTMQSMSHLDIEPLPLASKQLVQLEAFLNTLTSSINLDKSWLQDPK